MNDNVPMEENHPEKSVDELLSDLNDPDPTRRVDILNSLARLGVKEKKLINALRLIARGDPDLNVRIAAKNTLKSLGIKTFNERSRGLDIGKKGFRMDAEFWIGAVLWIMLNFILGWLVLSSKSDAFTGAFQLVINVGLLIYFGFTRKNIALGMLAAFGFALMIPLCLGIFFLAFCFIGAGPR